MPALVAALRASQPDKDDRLKARLAATDRTQTFPARELRERQVRDGRGLVRASRGLRCR